MRVTLGGFELKEFEKPDVIPMGGTQMLAVREFPGGNTSMQDMGPSYRPVTWNGIFIGVDAYDRMMTVGLMRVAGKPVELSLDRITMKVMIEEFLPDYKNNNRIPFSITLRRVVDNRAFMQVANSIDRTIVNVSGSSNEDEKKPIMYEVKSGDTLMRIAAITKGDPNEWESIYRDNQDALANGPHLIYPGMKLVINRA